jgi:hypothetical protein
MSSTHSLVGRAFLAVGLMLGFYILAVAIAGALLYIPYVEWTYAGKLHLKLALFCILNRSTGDWYTHAATMACSSAAIFSTAALTAGA